MDEKSGLNFNEWIRSKKVVMDMGMMTHNKVIHGGLERDFIQKSWWPLDVFLHYVRVVTSVET